MDRGGGVVLRDRDPLPLNSRLFFSFAMQFLAKIKPNNRLTRPPPSETSGCKKKLEVRSQVLNRETLPPTGAYRIHHKPVRPFLCVSVCDTILTAMFCIFSSSVQTMEGPCEECCFPLTQERVDLCNSGDTPLMFAAYSGHDLCMNTWIFSGADVNTVNGCGETALMHATKKGNEKCVVILLQAGAEVNETNHDGDTALFYAVCEGHYNCAKMLIESRADVNWKNHNSDSPLILAASWNREECVALLLAVGS